MTEVPVMVVVPLEAVAVIVAVPTDTPVTVTTLAGLPVVLTVATEVLLEDQVMVAPLKATPF